MAVTQLDQSNIESTIQSNDTVIVDFWAPWCGPCRSFKPIFEAASERHPGVAFVACNTEEEQELAAFFQIRSIPTVMVFRQGIPVFAQPGLLPAEVVDEVLEKVGELDMDEVRAQLEAAQQS